MTKKRGKIPEKRAIPPKNRKISIPPPTGVPRDESFDVAPFLHALLAEISDAVVLTDLDFRVLASSSRTHEQGEILAERLIRHYPPNEASPDKASPCQTRSVYRPVCDGQGNRIGYIVREERAEEDTSLDPLTGVADRRKLESEFRRRSTVCRNHGEPLTLLFVDLDDFKPVNDSFGHWVGDQILMQFARLLQNHFREGDLVSRYGGDEFVILCPNCPPSTATKRIEAFHYRLTKQRIEAICPETGEAPRSISLDFSYGVVEWMRAETFEQVLHRADTALYRMKNSRRSV